MASESVRNDIDNKESPRESLVGNPAQSEQVALVPKLVDTPVQNGEQHSAMLKWSSLFLLVLQNSSVFVITRYTRVAHGRLYLASVVVMLVEIFKLLICLGLLLREAGGSPRALLTNLIDQVWRERRTTLLLGVPAACYALQNNLIFVAVSNLSAAAAQVLYQLKTLSTAGFTVLLLGRSFRVPQWISFGLLTAGVILVQSQDAKSAGSATGASPVLGAFAAVAASLLSGFAGVYLEKMFTTGSSSLWMRNVQLSIFSIPLQLVAIIQLDGNAVARHGVLQGFHASTWLLVVTQVAGALLIAVVIKFAGNVLKTFATSLALLATCGWSMLLFDFHPTNLFVTGVAMTASSIWLYARPDDAACIAGFLTPPAKRLLAAYKSDGKSELQQSNAEVV